MIKYHCSKANVIYIFANNMHYIFYTGMHKFNNISILINLKVEVLIL